MLPLLPVYWHRYPSREQYTEVLGLLVTKYPFLHDGVGAGYVSNLILLIFSLYFPLSGCEETSSSKYRYIFNNIYALSSENDGFTYNAQKSENISKGSLSPRLTLPMPCTITYLIRWKGERRYKVDTSGLVHNLASALALHAPLSFIWVVSVTRIYMFGEYSFFKCWIMMLIVIVIVCIQSDNISTHSVPGATLDVRIWGI